MTANCNVKYGSCNGSFQSFCLHTELHTNTHTNTHTHTDGGRVTHTWGKMFINIVGREIAASIYLS